jgi:chromosome segregation ATPase
MPSIEERLQALEQEHTQLKKTIELQTIAIGALVNKAALERLNEKYDKIFDALTNHDRFTNEQLAELRTQQIETDGKIAGLQTEMRQRFNEQDSKIATLQTTQTEHTAILEQHTTLLTEILARLPKPQ